MKTEQQLDCRQLINCYISSNFDIKAHLKFDKDLQEKYRTYDYQRPPLPPDTLMHHSEAKKNVEDQKNRKSRASTFMRLFQPLNKALPNDRNQIIKSENSRGQCSETGSKIDMTELLHRNSKNYSVIFKKKISVESNPPEISRNCQLDDILNQDLVSSHFTTIQTPNDIQNKKFESQTFNCEKSQQLRLENSFKSEYSNPLELEQNQKDKKFCYFFTKNLKKLDRKSSSLQLKENYAKKSQQ